MDIVLVVLRDTFSAHKIDAPVKGVFEFYLLLLLSFAGASTFMLCIDTPIGNSGIESVLSASGILISLFIALLVLIQGQYQRVQEMCIKLSHDSENQAIPGKINLRLQQDYTEIKKKVYQKLFAFVGMSIFLSIVLFLVAFFLSVVTIDDSKPKILIDGLLVFVALWMALYLFLTLRVLYYLIADEIQNN